MAENARDADVAQFLAATREGYGDTGIDVAMGAEFDRSAADLDAAAANVQGYLATAQALEAGSDQLSADLFAALRAAQERES
ncbi:MAG TPA: hypothetical protein VLH86_00180 [Patescibacteria group bacterium]|nr:hypothetical protein [Patescibacteria group bacterium]